MFNTGKDIDVLGNKINEDLQAIQEWLNCNKLSLNVLKTHYMIFLPRNKRANDIDIKIYGTRIQRVYVTKFLGVQIDAHLTWKSHIDYTCSKLSKCVGILAKARKKLSKSSLINLYYSFAYPYLIHCNHVWGHNYTTSLEKLHLLQKNSCKQNTQCVWYKCICYWNTYVWVYVWWCPKFIAWFLPNKQWCSFSWHSFFKPYSCALWKVRY